MGRVININVCSWAWVRSFHLLVAWSVITAIKGSMNSLLGNDFILNVILLFLMIVVPWAWYLCERLPSVWRLALVLPEISSLRLCEE